MNIYAQLVRLPAVLSTPGDSLLGGASSNSLSVFRSVGLMKSSAFIYMAGMALNDYADRDVDAVERPSRPIPSGRISEKRALAVGLGLLGAGVVVATIADGRRGLVKSTATATAVLAYDFVAKGTPAGPPTMAACRFLDVLLGASEMKSALVPATIVAAHTLAITGVSAYEVQGGTKTVGKLSAVATTGVAVAAVMTGGVRSVPSAALYALPSLQASRAAVDDPSPQRLQKIVGTGVMGMIPLQGALIAGRGKPVLGAAVTALHPLGRMLAKRRSVT